MRITPSAIIPLKVAVRDDFAVARTAPVFKLVPNVAGEERPEGERPKVGDPPPLVLYDGKTPPLEPAFDAAHDWDLESLKLGPGHWRARWWRRRTTAAPDRRRRARGP